MEYSDRAREKEAKDRKMTSIFHEGSMEGAGGGKQLGGVQIQVRKTQKRRKVKKYVSKGNREK